MNKKGFTLVELLVVIAIIGILSAIGLVALNGAREKARDAKKKSDLTQYRNAMLMYYDSNNQKYYQTNDIECLDSAGVLKVYNSGYTPDSDSNIFANPGPIIPDFLATPLMPKLANDEESSHYCYDVNNSGEHYILYTKLEGGEKLWYWISDENDIGTSTQAHTAASCTTGDCHWL